MVFSSSFFLTLILPVFIVLYLLADKKYRNYLLLVFSCFFYAWGAPQFIFVILGTTLLDFFLVRTMDAAEGKKKRRLLLLLSVSVNLGLLFYFKYCGFFVENFNDLVKVFGGETQINWPKLIFPIGISFYTFETITYVVDVYRRVHKPLTKFTDYLLYIICFPKLIAGPIIRYHEISDQISNRDKNDTVDMKLSGFYIFCTGLAKKVLIADTMGAISNAIYGHMETGEGAVYALDLTTSAAWIAAMAYTFQIYFDFSGYSNMAIGLAKIFGFVFPENFNSPYIAESITDFWRRWHITLGNWMKNYLYIPLGGNRVSKKSRLYFNLCLVFVLSGFWHGASWNFILWGLWHGLFLVLERIFLLRLTARIGRMPRILFTFFIVVLGWVMFRVENVNKAIQYIGAMFGVNNSKIGYPLSKQQIIIGIAALIFSWFCIPGKLEKFQDYFFNRELKLREHYWLAPVCVLLFMVSLAALSGSGFNSFIYFRF
ncbi:MAG: putative membrane protein involved in D-alanine export [Bacteroidetes bacterium]|nr:MAG: putative membrane protein involved in D-alanine export [Bacteroidota bacterium]